MRFGSVVRDVCMYACTCVCMCSVCMCILFGNVAQPVCIYVCMQHVRMPVCRCASAYEYVAFTHTYTHIPCTHSIKVQRPHNVAYKRSSQNLFRCNICTHIYDIYTNIHDIYAHIYTHTLHAWRQSPETTQFHLYKKLSKSE
jgi:hypothetical protein